MMRLRGGKLVGFGQSAEGVLGDDRACAFVHDPARQGFVLRWVYYVNSRPQDGQCAPAQLDTRAVGD